MREITGYNPHRMDAHLGPLALPKFKGYFVVQFQQTPVDMKTYGMDDAKAESSRGAYAGFKSGQTIQVRVAPLSSAASRPARIPSANYPDGISEPCRKVSARSGAKNYREFKSAER